MTSPTSGTSADSSTTSTFDDSRLQITARNHSMLLMAAAGSGPVIDLSETVPDAHGNGNADGDAHTHGDTAAEPHADAGVGIENAAAVCRC